MVYFLKALISLSKKLIIISFLFRLFSKIKWIRAIWILFNSFLTFIFGLAYSDVYGFNDIIESLKNYIEYIKNTKFYSLLIKIFKVTKEINQEEVITNKEILDHKEINKEIMTNKDILNENLEISRKSYNEIPNRWDNLDSKEISNENNNIPFYNNWYFWITVSILTVSLTYYYWDNVYDFVINYLNLKKDESNGSGTNTGITYNLKEVDIFF